MTAPAPAAVWDEGKDVVVSRSPGQLFWARLRSDRVALAALAFIVFEIVVALFAPEIVRALAHPPNA